MLDGRTNHSLVLPASSPAPTSVTMRCELCPPEAATALMKSVLNWLMSAPSAAEAAGGSLMGSKATSDDLHPSLVAI